MNNDKPPPFIFRLTGAILIFGAIFGLAASLGGLYGLWRVKEPIKESLISDITLLQTTLDSTVEGLSIASLSLQSASASLTSIENTLETVVLSLDESTPIILSLSDILDSDIPNTIQATQTSLVAAQSSARIIEDVLVAVTAIPFFPGDPYDPPVPLYVSLANVSSALDDLPESLATMESSLQDTNQNLDKIEIELTFIVKSIEEIHTSLTSAEDVILEYQQVLDQAITRTSYINNNIEGWFDLGVWMISFILIWISITQVGLLAQGFNMAQSRLEINQTSYASESLETKETRPLP